MDFNDKLRELGLNITEEQEKKFEIYFNLLIEWNNKINLTAITNKEDVYTKHFYDSITLVKAIDMNSITSICDIGAGAGFPSIPLKIMYPHLKITIIDSLNKRIGFLNLLCTELKLENVNAIHGRAEEVIEQYREYFDVVTARAVARLNILTELCSPYAKVNGHFIALKAQSADEELLETTNNLKQLNLLLEETISFLLDETSTRNILKFKKVKKTNRAYPRQFAKIKKNPL